MKMQTLGLAGVTQTSEISKQAVKSRIVHAINQLHELFAFVGSGQQLLAGLEHCGVMADVPLLVGFGLIQKPRDDLQERQANLNVTHVPATALAADEPAGATVLAGTALARAVPAAVGWVITP